MRLEGLPFDHADFVEVDRERARGGDLRVELAQGARCRIARVDERLFAALEQLLVHALEVFALDEHLAAHLEQLGQPLAFQVQREILDGLEVLGDVFADGAVAARAALHELAVLEHELDGEPVHLRLAGVRHCFHVQRLAHPFVELDELGLVEDVAQGQHLLPVRHLGKLLQHRAADPLRGGIGGHQFGVLGLEGEQLVHQRVVCRV